MSTTASRAVLDWFRTWANTRLDAIGRTDITSNMNAPINSDVRVRAGIGYVEQVEADVWALYDPSWDAVWLTLDTLAWFDAMPPDVAADWSAMWDDPDDNVRRLLKSTVRMVTMVELANAVGM